MVDGNRAVPTGNKITFDAGGGTCFPSPKRLIPTTVCFGAGSFSPSVLIVEHYGYRTVVKPVFIYGKLTTPCCKNWISFLRQRIRFIFIIVLSFQIT